nr:unnamed protein product [Callosobruchus analis]
MFKLLPEGKHQVCKITFLGTLGIKEKMVVNWVSEGQKFGILDSKETRNKYTNEKKANPNYLKITKKGMKT